MSLVFFASMNQTHVGASITASISDTPLSPPTSNAGGGGTLCHNLITTLWCDLPKGAKDIPSDSIFAIGASQMFKFTGAHIGEDGIISINDQIISKVCR